MTYELRGLFLDFDGTIAETERFGHRVAYNLAFAELGLDCTWEEDLYGELLAVAGGKERLRHFFELHRPGLLGGAAASGLIGEIYRAKTRHFAQIAPAIPLRSGLLRLVREANTAGVIVAIATTGHKPGVEAVLSKDQNLLAMITLIAANDTVERKKPEPDVYLWALAQLGLDAADCVAIEDSNVGLRAALAAHLPTVVTVSDYTAKEDFAGARAVLSALGEPDVPARSVYGPTPGNGMVDLAFLDNIRASASRPPAD